MKTIVVWIIGMIISIESFSQHLNKDSSSVQKFEYYFQVQTGALIGCTSCSNGKQISFSGSTTHGIKVGRKLRVGAGIGLDSYYEWNTIPVFGSVSWDIVGKKNALFAELNYGGTLASWRYVNFPEYGYQDSEGGNMYSYGLGYRIKYDKIRISAGVSRKTQVMTSYYEYPTYYWDYNNYIVGEPSTKTVKNELNRLMVWVAVGWK